MAHESVSLNVEGMSCPDSVSSIKKSVGALDGVTNVGVDIRNKKVSVTYDPNKLDVDIIKDVIEEHGYDVMNTVNNIYKDGLRKCSTL
ncbi:MAG: copper ion binding protein [Bacillota bacterium]